MTAQRASFKLSQMGGSGVFWALVTSGAAVVSLVVGACSSRSVTDEQASGGGAGSAGTAGAGGSGTGGSGTGGGGTGGAAGAASGGASGAGASGGASACGVGALCVQAAPIGWQGPVAVHQGVATAAPPDCTALGLTMALTAYAEDNWPAATCTACTCAAPTGRSCSADVLVGTNAACNGNETITGIGKTCKPASLNASTIHGMAQIDSTKLVGGSCASGGGQPQLGLPTTGKVLRACAGLDASATCAGKCVLEPPTETPGLCIYKTGDVPCPAGEYTSRVLVSTVKDTRGCSPCACGAPGGGACSATVQLHSNKNCSFVVGTLTTPAACKALSGLIYGDASAQITAETIANPGACAKSGGQPTGSVMANSATTVCCRP